MSGLPSSETFRVYGTIKNTRLTILIDSGSTHNFLQARVAQFLNLPVETTRPLRVLIGNGSVLDCNQHCPDTQLSIQGHSFPSTFGINPSQVYNYTATPPVVASQTTNDTKAYRLAFNSTVHVVLQDTGAIAPKSLPVHLHGFNFSVVGSGVGNYDPKTNQNNFNLVDPVERNTIGVPTGGWIAFRFRADNPGVWFFHCHFEVHITGGLKMIFLVHTNKGRPSYA
ncbi:Laccase-22 [Glycine soja]|uniref:Laccase-22 n=1 Tax=Glycine soja TaxID=3848 RepID=A0A0B2QSB1_GLYSO|nr:Laccase-22 [Glycine soja]